MRHPILHRGPRWRARSAMVLAGALMLAGCDVVGVSIGDRGPETVDGTWSGQVRGEVIEMTLDQTGHRGIEGFGVLRGQGSSRAFRVEGVRDSSRVTLLLEISVVAFGEPGLILAHFRGRFTSRDRMEGTLSGGGFNDAGLSLRREPDVFF